MEKYRLPPEEINYFWSQKNKYQWCNKRCDKGYYHNCTRKNVETNSNIELFKSIVDNNKDKNTFHIILDNASWNKSEKIYDFINELKVKNNININLVFLPPYSPNLNLIERLWRLSKKILLANKYYISFKRFKFVIKQFFKKDIKNYQFEINKLITNNFQIF